MADRYWLETAKVLPVRCLAVLVLVVVFTSVVPTAAAHGSSEDGSAPAGPAAWDRLAEEFSAVLSLREAPDSMCLSVLVDGDPIFESRSGTSFTPASLMKVAAAAAAFEVIRPDDVFSTQVFARTEDLGSVTDGVLEGDVYLVGQGDPVLSTPRYVGRYGEPVPHTDITVLADRVFAALSARGITRIEGRLVGDESWYPDRRRDYSGEFLAGEADPVWKRSFVTANLAGPLSALLLNSGYSRYSGSVWGEGRSLNVRAAEPARHAASVFDDFLEARGMVITRRPVAGAAPASSERKLLGTVDSPPLSEIVARMLAQSDNTIAEMLLKEIGRRLGGSDRASAAAGVDALLGDKLGPVADGLLVADGSGLSYSNRLTCRAAAGLLAEAGPGSPLVEGLAVAGGTGSLKTCAPVRSTTGQDELLTVKGKTGTLNHVTALAGTAVAGNGEVVTFAMIANKPGAMLLGICNHLRMTLLNAAANYTYGPPPTGLPAHAGDRAALVALYDSTGGDAWFNSWRWKTAAPLDQWHGVVTDSDGRVIAIDLGGGLFGNGLTGSIPGEIGGLSELARLDLSGNDLVGALPSRLSDLPKLTDLRLSGTEVCLPRSAHSDGSLVEERLGADLMTCPPSADTPVDTRFADLTGGPLAWAVKALAERGILDGTECGTDRICPDQAIKRRTVAVWLVRAVDGEDPPTVDGTRFDDVSGGAWWTPYVERLADLQITKGCATEPLRYCPHDPVTRGQMASFLMRAFGLEPAPTAGFTDTGGGVHEADIDALYAAGITAGCHINPLRYCPEDPVTRAQMATFIARALRLG